MNPGIFFPDHDPTTRSRQAYNTGSSYRSALFYTNERQKQIIAETSADVEASKVWPRGIVIEVAPASPFWKAEPEHQNYLQFYPDGYTCHFIRPNSRLPGRTIAVEVQLHEGTSS